METLALESFLTAQGTLIFTLTSNGYKFYTLNLVRHLQRIGVAWRLCIFCADAASHKFFSQEGIPCRRLPDLLPEFGSHVVPFGTRQFQQLNRKKLDILKGLVGRADVKTGIYMDGDIVVYRDFLADVEGRLDVDPARILFQCDENEPRLDCSGSACPTPCSGFLAWRHGGAATPDLFRIDDSTREIWRECPEDQVFIQKMLKRSGAAYGTLPRELYPNGRFSGRGGLRGQGDPFLLHYNYLIGDAKRQRMRVNGDWLLPY